jgi:hypothetical protein
MISYSDYVLSTNPWAYWPLNDTGLTMYPNENHLMMDVSGKERHMTVLKDSVSYLIPITGYYDALPLRGINAPTQTDLVKSIPPALTEIDSRLWLSSGKPMNDTPGFTNSKHDMWFDKVRAEWLMTPTGGGPVLSVGRTVHVGKWCDFGQCSSEMY